MSKIMRSVERDLLTMSLGLGAIDKEIEYWQKKGSTDRSTKKRLERLQAAKQQLIENPEQSKELMEKLR